MVQPGRRRLNPAQASGFDHGRPIDGHLGVTTKDIGAKNLFGDPLLSRIDQLRRRRRRRDLLTMSFFDRVTKHDSHGWIPDCNSAAWPQRLTFGNSSTDRELAVAATRRIRASRNPSVAPAVRP